VHTRAHDYFPRRCVSRKPYPATSAVRFSLSRVQLQHSRNDIHKRTRLLQFLLFALTAGRAAALPEPCKPRYKCGHGRPCRAEVAATMDPGTPKPLSPSPGPGSRGLIRYRCQPCLAWTAIPDDSTDTATLSPQRLALPNCGRHMYLPRLSS
jgi:hypothetical protein